MDGRNHMSAGNSFASITEGAGPNLDTLGDVLITGGAGFLGRYFSKRTCGFGNKGYGP
jgi:hypothetical protein